MKREDKYQPKHTFGSRKFDWVTVLLIIAGIALVAFSLWRGWFLVSSQYEQEQTNRFIIEQSVNRVNNWPSAKQKEILKEAESYNATVNPLTHDLNVNHEESDKKYFSTLDTGNGVIGSISIPSISADIPIRHGSSDYVLSNGVGHLWGTDLPLGEDGDFSVISGHSGGVRGLFFTRVPQLRKGDYFYVNVLGKETGYRIDKIQTVPPDDVSVLRELYRSGEKARVTLVTCVPIGVNTDRLLVSGVATDSAPVSSEAPSDSFFPRGVIVITGVVITSLLLVFLAVALISRRRRVGKHVMGLAV